jgi:hypothetical protein
MRLENRLRFAVKQEQGMRASTVNAVVKKTETVTVG